MFKYVRKAYFFKEMQKNIPGHVVSDLGGGPALAGPGPVHDSHSLIVIQVSWAQLAPNRVLTSLFCHGHIVRVYFWTFFWICMYIVTFEQQPPKSQEIPQCGGGLIASDKSSDQPELVRHQLTGTPSTDWSIHGVSLFSIPECV